MDHLDINSQKWSYWSKGTFRHFYGPEAYYQNVSKGLMSVGGRLSWVFALRKPPAGKSLVAQIRAPREVWKSEGLSRPAKS